VEDYNFTLPKKELFRSSVKLMLTFLTLRASCVRNLFHQDSWWMENSIATFWDDLEKISGAYVKTSDNHSWALHHYNARAHASLVVRQFWVSTNTAVILHPLYSPDRILCNYSYSRIWNWSWRGDFDSIEEIQTESQDVMTLTQNDYQQCFRLWKSRWDRCINAEGDYFEGSGGEYKFR
jgi:hypothetical protein